MYVKMELFGQKVYYVKERHPAIIDKKIWEAVQLEMKKKDYMERHRVRQLDFIRVEDNPFTGRVSGSVLGRKTWNSTDGGLKRRVWQCNRKYEKKGEVRCRNKHIDEDVLYKAIISSFNVLVENKEYFIEKWKAEDGDELKKYRVNEFIEIIEDGIVIEEFDIDLYFKMIEKMVVFEDRVIVGFLNGAEVECTIQ
ncbi:recombinase zinc beta ribbon domain-containing protein [Tissierella sp. MB52-C2]|uniref:recombinase zinc beta ribbon domain-containing protein n=1 Tax=Tissierella sp. MB52-C2 TaxID=3070999 RepID=UPI00280AE156|nr:recombinase zinc beta ribbon domain-containing protein [Tissierella sp. MB52-C2]WMM26124.1 recombinase zinc beta ribbon domain-containing protein [Tissierella sp. MB52-C2]